MVERRPQAAHNDGGRRRPTARRLLPRLPLLLGGVGLGGCELTEVSVPLGEPVIVVHSIIRPDLPARMQGRQYVIVERTFTGNTEPIEDPATGDTIFQVGEHYTIPYGGLPSLPVTDAVVTIKNLDDPGDPCGVTLFVADPGTPVRSTQDGLYWGPIGCPSLRAGERLELRVEVPGEGVVTGITRVPGVSSARFTVAGVEAAFDTGLVTTFNRDHDTLRFDIDAESGRLLQLEVRKRTELTDYGTKIFADTMAFVLPGDVINSFIGGDEDFVFRGGRDYAVTVAVTDTNYFDFARSDNNRYTGRGFINHLEGGLGVFGAMVARTTYFHVVADVDDQREGTYRLTGALDPFGSGGGRAVSVDLTWELYLRSEGDPTEFSAFVSGDWMFGPINTTADGFFANGRFTATFVDTLPDGGARRDTLRGRWLPDSAFTLAVIRGCRTSTPLYECNEEQRTVGTVQIVKQ